MKGRRPITPQVGIIFRFPHTMELVAQRCGDVLAEERAQLGTRSRIGIALSGGGIRQASFACGVLRAMAKKGTGRCILCQDAGRDASFLSVVDCVSAVSGGSFAATAWLTCMAESGREQGARAACDQVEENIGYCVDRHNWWHFVRDVALLVFVLICSLLTNALLLGALAIMVSLLADILLGPALRDALTTGGFDARLWCFFIITAVLGITCGVLWAYYARYVGRRQWDSKYYGSLGTLGKLLHVTAVAMIFYVGIVYQDICDLWTDRNASHGDRVAVCSILAGTVLMSFGIVTTSLLRTPGEELRFHGFGTVMATLLRLVARVLAPLAVVFVFALVGSWRMFDQKRGWSVMHWFDMASALILAFEIAVRYEWLVSIFHRYYKRCLAASFVRPPTDMKFEELPSDAPLYICNMSLNDYRRPTDLELFGPFMMTQMHYGSQRTGYFRTSACPEATLGMGMALSGAAVSVSFGSYENSLDFLKFLLTLITVSGGVWFPLRNVKPKATRFFAVAWFVLLAIWAGLKWPSYLAYRALITGTLGIALVLLLLSFTSFLEDLGPLQRLFVGSTFFRQFHQALSFPYVSDKAPDKVYLTDGGHVENLGAFELLRRKLPHIVAVSGEHDPENTCDDLISLVQNTSSSWESDKKEDPYHDKRSLRRELHESGVKVYFWDNHDTLLNSRRRLNDLVKQTIGSGATHIVLRTTYDENHTPSQNGAGYFIYLKKTQSKDHRTEQTGSSCFCCCECANPFPHHPTRDQFFTRETFRDYADLGYRNGMRMLESIESRGPPV